MSKAVHHKKIFVYADWLEQDPQLMGELNTEQIRGKEIFSFSYEREWLEHKPAYVIDPALQLYSGPQYNHEEQPNFGLFMDSSPDRWGRKLMERREAFRAKKEERRPRALMESDYLLGVYDLYRMGGIRFKVERDGPYLDNDDAMAAPPMTFLRTLEEASYQIENEDSISNRSYGKWLNVLLQPGSSLGGARPKASVIDKDGHLWIAKFPSRNDERDIGGWETVVNELGIRCGVKVAEGKALRLAHNHHTFLTKRFDRNKSRRIHFASAMTMLGQTDGAGSSNNISYLHLAEFLMRHGAKPGADLEELWRRIVFNICVSNSDDHLRNHGFLLTDKGWVLSPAFDINPIPLSNRLSLNITENNNEMDIELALEVAERFRVSAETREAIIKKVISVMRQWEGLAKKIGIPRNQMQVMENAFTVK